MGYLFHVAFPTWDRIVSIYGTTQRARRSIISPSGINGTIIETAWIATHLVLYPLHILKETNRDQEPGLNVDNLPPIQRSLLHGNVEAAGTPIILVHGVIDNRSIFTVLRRALRRRGFGRTYTLDYSPFTEDIREVAYRLGDLVEQVCHDTGFERVHVIGHSMGGLVGRYYVQRLDGHTRVHTLVTLGTPHQGTRVADFVPHPLARQMRANSTLIDELDQPVDECDTRIISIWSDLDQSIIPKQHAKVIHPDLRARNIFVRGVGHMSLPVDGRVVHEISTVLAHVDHDGSIITEGATSIGSEVTPPRRRESEFLDRGVSQQ